MDKAKSPIKRNQLGKSNPKQKKWFQCISIKHLLINSKDLLVGIAMQKAKHLVSGMVLSQYEAKKAGE